MDFKKRIIEELKLSELQAETLLKDYVITCEKLAKEYHNEQLSICSVVKSLNADELIKSLGSPDTDNEYRIKADKNGKWWIDHKHVGSGEPLKQWLTGKP